MRALTFTKANHLEWHDDPEPKLQSDTDVLIRPLAAAACDLDAAIIAGLTPYEPPFAIGHEFVGEIIDAGEAAGVAIGDRVALPFQISCGRCAFCQRGLTQNCTEVPRTSMFGLGATGGGWGGAFSDSVRVPYAPHMLIPLDESIAPEVAACLGDNLADGLRAALPLQETPGPVLVLSGGLKGSVPLYAALAAIALGAESVDFYDADKSRLQAAERLGAKPYETTEWPNRLGNYPVTIDATQAPKGLACALRSTAPGGTCTSTSMYFEALVGVPMTEMYMKGVTLRTGRVASRTSLPTVFAMVASGTIDPSQVPVQSVAWNDLDRALLDFDLKLVASRPR